MEKKEDKGDSNREGSEAKVEMNKNQEDQKGKVIGKVEEWGKEHKDGEAG